MIGLHKKGEPSDLQSRQAILWMHPSALIPLMTSARWVITEGHLPVDTQYHHVFWDSGKQIWGVVCISKEFKVVKMAQQLPELPQVKFKFYAPGKDGIIE